MSDLSRELVDGVVKRLPKHKQVRTEGSCDEELESVSSLDYKSASSSAEENISEIISCSEVYPPANLWEGSGGWGRRRRSSTLFRDLNESEECIESVICDLTPFKASSSLSQLLYWSGCRRLEMDDVMENWMQLMQILMEREGERTPTVSYSETETLVTESLFLSINPSDISLTPSPRSAKSPSDKIDSSAQGEPHCDRSPSNCIALITVLNHSVPERQSLVA